MLPPCRCYAADAAMLYAADVDTLPYADALRHAFCHADIFAAV